MPRIYHIALVSELRQGVAGDRYTPARFAAEGFVHCSGSAETILAVAGDYYAEVTEPVLVLEIDPERLSARVVYEPPAPLTVGGSVHRRRGELFPHVYGPVDLDAVTGAALLGAGDTSFRWPERFAPLAAFLASAPD